jgi:uncharacterized protein (TIGR04551 family)
MQTRFRPAFVAFSLFSASTALGQTAAPRPDAKPAAKPAAPAPAAPAPAPTDAAAPGEDAASDVTEPVTPPAEPSAAEPAPAPATPLPRAPVNTLPLYPSPSADAAALDRVGKERPAAARSGDETDVFADDWWSHARPVLELHGNFRVRAEMFYRFSLGRVDEPASSLWPRPPDAPYTTLTLPHGSAQCTPDEAGAGSSTDTSALVGCKNNTQAGANLRFRLNPEIHVSDNLRVMSQIDLLDNVVLGSTSSGYSVTPRASSLNSGYGGYGVGARNGYEPTSFNDQTTNPPRSGVNSFSDSIHVKRVWGEYSTPVGELRFGRMPNHWGMGLVNHSGDGPDADYQSTIDRLQFIAGIKPLDLYISGAWDFPNEGGTSSVISSPAAQPYDLAQLDDVDQYTFSIARRKSPELTRLALTRGDLVINGGVQFTYRKQLLANDLPTDTSDCSFGAGAVGCGPDATYKLVRRDAHYVLPDVWLQLLYKGFRFEAEAATIQGSTHNPENRDQFPTNSRYRFSSWGLVTELEQALIENKLHLGFNFGWASGDADVDGLQPSNNSSSFGQLGGDRKISTFRFNPAYRVDLILFRNILSRVQGAYYFRPSLAYDFLRDHTGQRLGGSVAGIWSRASEFIQAPGHDRDLGIELNGALYFQSKDGALNDDPNRMGGFYARLEYGILFPMAGLGYPAGTLASIRGDGRLGNGDTSSAQILRLYLGVLF